MESEGSLPHSQSSAISPYPEHQRMIPSPGSCEMFCNVLSLYGKKLLGPRPNLKLETTVLLDTSSRYKVTAGRVE